MKFSWKVTYPDGDVEFWYNTVAETISELTQTTKKDT